MLPRKLKLERPIRAEDFITPDADAFLHALKLDKPELARVCQALANGKGNDAICAYIAHFRSKDLASPVLHNNPLFWNITGEPRNPKFNHGRSDQYLAGHFQDGYCKHDGTGKSVDWRNTPLGCLTRFPMFRDLLQSAHHSDDPRYTRFIIEHGDEYMNAWPLEAFVGQNTIEQDENHGVSDPWHWGVVHNRLRRWAEVVVQLRHSPHVSDDELAAILFRMLQETRFLMHNVQLHVDHKHNSGGTMLLSLLCVSEVLDDFSESNEWRARLVTMTRQFIETAFYPDGMFKELTTGYSSELALTIQVLAYALRDHPEVAGQRERLREIVTAMIALTHPSGMQPLYGDAWLVRVRDWLYPPLLDWLELPWAKPFVGKPGPATPFTAWPRNDQPAWCGYYAMRSDWSKQANTLIIDGGPWGLSHMHCDRLSFTLSALGQDFITDPGNSTYRSSDSDARISMLEAGFLHNTVTVDGVDEFIKPPHWWETDRPLDNLWQHTDHYTLFAGTFDFEPVKRVRWQRRVLFVDGSYWLLQDVLIGEQDSAAIEQNFQFEWDIKVEFDDGKTIATAPNGTRLLIVPLQNPLPPVLSIGDTTPHSTYTTVWQASTTKRQFELGRGWVGGRRGSGVVPAPAVTYRGAVALPAMFTSALIPLAIGTPGSDAPRIRFNTSGAETIWTLPTRAGNLIFSSSLDACRVQHQPPSA
jgi:hypothetical protein